MGELQKTGENRRHVVLAGWGLIMYDPSQESQVHVQRRKGTRYGLRWRYVMRTCGIFFWLLVFYHRSRKQVCQVRFRKGWGKMQRMAKRKTCTYSTNVGKWENVWTGRMAGRIKVCLESNDHVFKVKPIILIVHFVLFISAAGFNHRRTQKAYFNQGCDLAKWV